MKFYAVLLVTDIVCAQFSLPGYTLLLVISVDKLWMLPTFSCDKYRFITDLGFKITTGYHFASNILNFVSEFPQTGDIMILILHFVDYRVHCYLYTSIRGYCIL